MNFEYTIILVGLLLVTLFIEKKHKIHLYRSKMERFEIVMFFFLFGVAWDSFAIFREHWAFPAGHTLGIVIGFMPLEEYFFCLIVPYFVITFYKLMDSKFRNKR